MKAAVFDGVPELPGIFAVSVYDIKPVHFLSMCCNTIKQVQKSGQMYDPKTQMVHATQFLSLNVNDY